MADPLKKPGDDRTRRPDMTPDTTETTPSTMRDDRPLTEKVGEKLRDVKEDVKEKVEPGKTEAERTGMGLPPRTTTTKGADWNDIQNPGCTPECDTDYGARPVSELKPPTTVSDKADLAATRMLGREKMDREKMDREAIMSTATMEAAAMRTGMASKDMPMKDMPSKEMTRTEPVAGERTIRQGAAIGTEPTRPIPMTGTVVPPGTERMTPLAPYGTMDERSRMHAEDPSVHPDWKTEPQINAPRDVGIPTPEGQADLQKAEADRMRRETERDRKAAERRTERDMRTNRGPVQAVKEDLSKATEATKEKARNVKEDVDRKI